VQCNLTCRPVDYDRTATSWDPAGVRMAHVWTLDNASLPDSDAELGTGQPSLPDLKRQHCQLLQSVALKAAPPSHHLAGLDHITLGTCTLFGSARLHLLFSCIVDNC